MKKQVLSIGGWSAALVLLGFVGLQSGFLEAGTAQAIGDLTIDWGVPTGDPIFTVSNFLPGEVEPRTVEITNNGTVPRTVGVRGMKTGGSGRLEKALDIVIEFDGDDIYGGDAGSEDLDDFFDDSEGGASIALFVIDPGDTEELAFTVLFNESAGNNKQEDSVVFDIVLGIAGAEAEVPEECSDIEFSGPAIFGTADDDHIEGTNGNDLIFGFEGDDNIDGKRGRDCIVGGAGDDSIDGGRGADVIFGDGGADRLEGGRGDDLMFGGAGPDRMEGGRGNDVMRGNGGPDKMEGDRGNDELRGNGGDDELEGDRGDDELIGGGGFDEADGGRNTDTCDAEVEKDCEL